MRLFNINTEFSYANFTLTSRVLLKTVEMLPFVPLHLRGLTLDYFFILNVINMKINKYKYNLFKTHKNGHVIYLFFISNKNLKWRTFTFALVYPYLPVIIN